MPEFESINRTDSGDLSKIKDWSIAYMSQKKVIQISDLLNKISKKVFPGRYNLKELNDNGVYPQNWNRNKSSNKEFNGNNISEG